MKENPKTPTKPTKKNSKEETERKGIGLFSRSRLKNPSVNTGVSSATPTSNSSQSQKSRPTFFNKKAESATTRNTNAVGNHRSNVGLKAKTPDAESRKWIFKKPNNDKYSSSSDKQHIRPISKSALALNNNNNEPKKSAQKLRRPISAVDPTHITVRRGQTSKLDGQIHTPEDLSRASSVTNLNVDSKAKGAKPRKTASRDRLDKIGDKKNDKKGLPKNNNKLDGDENPHPSEVLQEVESLQKQLQEMANEKTNLALQLGEQNGELNRLQIEISKLKMFQEQSHVQLEQLSDENTILRNRLRDVAHSPLSDNEKQQLLYESHRHHSSAPASIATNIMDENGGDVTACPTPEWDKQSSGNVSEVSVACLQDKINQMQETHYSTNEELQATLQELTDLQRQLTELQQENERLVEEKNLMFDSLCRQTERLNDSRSEVDSLKQLLYRDKESGDQYESAAEREQKLVDLLKSAQEEREELLLKQDQLSTELQEGRDANLIQNEDITQLSERVRTLESTLDAKHAEHKQLDQELAQAKDQCSGRQIEINRLKDLLEIARTKINELEHDRALIDKSELDELLDNTRKEKDSLESEVAELKEQLARSRNEIEKLREQVSILQEECKVIRNNAKTTQSDLEYKNDKLLLEKSELTERLQHFQDAINELQVQSQCQAEDKRQLSAVLSETQRNLSEAERKISSLDCEIAELKKLREEENEEWEKFQNDLLTSVRVANDFKTEAQQDLQKMIMENKAHRERVKQLENQIDKLKGLQRDILITEALENHSSKAEEVKSTSIQSNKGKSLKTSEFFVSNSPAKSPDSKSSMEAETKIKQYSVRQKNVLVVNDVKKRDKVNKKRKEKVLSKEEKQLLSDLDCLYMEIDPDVPVDALNDEQKVVKALKKLYENESLKQKPVAPNSRDKLAISKPLLQSVYLDPKLQDIATSSKFIPVEAIEIIEDSDDLDSALTYQKHQEPKRIKEEASGWTFPSFFISTEKLHKVKSEYFKNRTSNDCIEKQLTRTYSLDDNLSTLNRRTTQNSGLLRLSSTENLTTFSDKQTSGARVSTKPFAQKKFYSESSLNVLLRNEDGSSVESVSVYCEDFPGGSEESVELVRLKRVSSYLLDPDTKVEKQGLVDSDSRMLNSRAPHVNENLDSCRNVPLNFEAPCIKTNIKSRAESSSNDFKQKESTEKLSESQQFSDQIRSSDNNITVDKNDRPKSAKKYGNIKITFTNKKKQDKKKHCPSINYKTLEEICSNIDPNLPEDQLTKEQVFAKKLLASLSLVGRKVTLKRFDKIRTQQVTISVPTRESVIENPKLYSFLQGENVKSISSEENKRPESKIVENIEKTKNKKEETQESSTEKEVGNQLDLNEMDNIRTRYSVFRYNRGNKLTDASSQKSKSWNEISFNFYGDFEQQNLAKRQKTDHLNKNNNLKDADDFIDSSTLCSKNEEILPPPEEFSEASNYFVEFSDQSGTLTCDKLENPLTKSIKKPLETNESLSTTCEQIEQDLDTNPSLIELGDKDKHLEEVGILEYKQKEEEMPVLRNTELAPVKIKKWTEISEEAVPLEYTEPLGQAKTKILIDTQSGQIKDAVIVDEGEFSKILEVLECIKTSTSTCQFSADEIEEFLQNERYYSSGPSTHYEEASVNITRKASENPVDKDFTKESANLQTETTAHASEEYNFVNDDNEFYRSQVPEYSGVFEQNHVYAINFDFEEEEDLIQNAEKEDLKQNSQKGVEKDSLSDEKLQLYGAYLLPEDAEYDRPLGLREIYKKVVRDIKRKHYLEENHIEEDAQQPDAVSSLGEENEDCNESSIAKIDYAYEDKECEEEQGGSEIPEFEENELKIFEANSKLVVDITNKRFSIPLSDVSDTDKKIVERYQNFYHKSKRSIEETSSDTEISEFNEELLASCHNCGENDDGSYVDENHTLPAIKIANYEAEAHENEDITSGNLCGKRNQLTRSEEDLVNAVKQRYSAALSELNDSDLDIIEMFKKKYLEETGDLFKDVEVSRLKNNNRYSDKVVDMTSESILKEETFEDSCVKMCEQFLLNECNNSSPYKVLDEGRGTDSEKSLKSLGDNNLASENEGEKIGDDNLANENEGEEKMEDIKDSHSCEQDLLSITQVCGRSEEELLNPEESEEIVKQSNGKNQPPKKPVRGSSAVDSSCDSPKITSKTVVVAKYAPEMVNSQNKTTESYKFKEKTLPAPDDGTLALKIKRRSFDARDSLPSCVVLQPEVETKEFRRSFRFTEGQIPSYEPVYANISIFPSRRSSSDSYKLKSKKPIALPRKRSQNLENFSYEKEQSDIRCEKDDEIDISSRRSTSDNHGVVIASFPTDCNVSKDKIEEDGGQSKYMSRKPGNYHLLKDNSPSLSQKNSHISGDKFEGIVGKPKSLSRKDGFSEKSDNKIINPKVNQTQEILKSLINKTGIFLKIEKSQYFPAQSKNAINPKSTNEIVGDKVNTCKPIVSSGHEISKNVNQNTCKPKPMEDVPFEEFSDEKFELESKRKPEPQIKSPKTDATLTSTFLNIERSNYFDAKDTDLLLHKPPPEVTETDARENDNNPDDIKDILIKIDRHDNPNLRETPTFEVDIHKMEPGSSDQIENIIQPSSTSNVKVIISENALENGSPKVFGGVERYYDTQAVPNSQQPLLLTHKGHKERQDISKVEPVEDQSTQSSIKKVKKFAVLSPPQDPGSNITKIEEEDNAFGFNLPTITSYTLEPSEKNVSLQQPISSDKIDAQNESQLNLFCLDSSSFNRSYTDVTRAKEESLFDNLSNQKAMYSGFFRMSTLDEAENEVGGSSKSLGSNSARNSVTRLKYMFENINGRQDDSEKSKTTPQPSRDSFDLRRDDLKIESHQIGAKNLDSRLSKSDDSQIKPRIIDCVPSPVQRISNEIVGANSSYDTLERIATFHILNNPPSPPKRNSSLNIKTSFTNAKRVFEKLEEQSKSNPSSLADIHMKHKLSDKLLRDPNIHSESDLNKKEKSVEECCAVYKPAEELSDDFKFLGAVDSFEFLETRLRERYSELQRKAKDFGNKKPEEYALLTEKISPNDQELLAEYRQKVYDVNNKKPAKARKSHHLEASGETSIKPLDLEEQLINMTNLRTIDEDTLGSSDPRPPYKRKILLDEKDKIFSNLEQEETEADKNLSSYDQFDKILERLQTERHHKVDEKHFSDFGLKFNDINVENAVNSSGLDFGLENIEGVGSNTESHPNSEEIEVEQKNHNYNVNEEI